MLDPVAATLAAVLAEPDDDLHRLAHADALDKAGDATGPADLIRWGLGRGHAERPPDGAVRLAKQEMTVFGLIDNWGWGVFPRRIEMRNCCLGPRVSVAVERGLPAAVECPRALWLACGPAVAARWPVTRVRLSDLTPSHGGGGASDSGCNAPANRSCRTRCPTNGGRGSTRPTPTTTGRPPSPPTTRPGRRPWRGRSRRGGVESRHER